jgi:hypothetical protein
VWLIGLFQILVPLIFIAIIAFQPQPNRWRWALNTLAYGLAITFMILSSRWDLVSIYLRILYPVLLAVAILISYKRTGSSGKPQSRIQAGLNISISVAGLNISISVILIGLMGGLSWQPLKGYPTPPDAMDLVSPLRDGNYVVLHGGASPFINGHFKVRPQTFALDIVGLNRLGLRATARSACNRLFGHEEAGKLRNIRGKSVQSVQRNRCSGS